MFEDLGLKYVGPVDGHDIKAMESALRRARSFGGPVIVHAVTTKGYGYPPAETDQIDAWHATGIFDPDSGASTAAARDWTAAFSDELVRIGAERADVVAITAAMLHPTGLAAFAERYPERTFDVGIAEQHALTSAAGMAMAGLHPVVAVYSTFLNRAFDQLLMDVALHGQPVTVVLDRAGVTGTDGASHNGMWDMSILSVVPGLRLAAPRDEATLREALREAVAVTDGPTVVRFPKGVPPVDIPALERRGPVDVLRRGERAGRAARRRRVDGADVPGRRRAGRRPRHRGDRRRPALGAAGLRRAGGPRRRLTGWSSRWRTAAGPGASARR